MIFQYPLTQERLVLIQRKIPVFGFLHHRLATADGRLRIDQVCSIQRSTAGFALVAIRFFVAAMRTCTGYIAVGEELFSFLVVVLLACLFDEFAFLIQGAEEVRCHLSMCRRSCTGIDIERDTEVLKRFLDDAMKTIHHILRCNPFFLSAKGNRHTVLVRSPDHQNILSLQAKVTGIYIGRHIHTSQVPDMYRPVRIRQRRSNQRSLKLFFHTLCSLFEGQRYGNICEK